MQWRVWFIPWYMITFVFLGSLCRYAHGQPVIGELDATFEVHKKVTVSKKVSSTTSKRICWQGIINNYISSNQTYPFRLVNRWMRKPWNRKVTTRNGTEKERKRSSNLCCGERSINWCVTERYKRDADSPVFVKTGISIWHSHNLQTWSAVLWKGEYSEFIKIVAARVNLGSSTRTRRFRTGQKKYIRRVLKCFDSMLLKTCSRLNSRRCHIYFLGFVFSTTASAKVLFQN